ncbi:MAG: DUF1549 domain-containing protein, partial [Planctomycetales bacterium]|nr:DUF1549 domain-containing protein [Planctomycetales bacterium]
MAIFGTSGRLAAALTLALTAGTQLASGEPSGEPNYARDVRPILTDKCYQCHGPDEGSREAGLRFDQQEATFAELESGARAIVPHDPEASELLTRIETDDADLQMPPPDAEKQLTDAERQTLRAWIAAGAPWERHWAFIAPHKPQVPSELDPNVTAIDRFARRRLRAEGLDFAAPADRETLLRRVTLDLTGLPPTLAEIDAFAEDRSPDAYERVVD